MSSFMKRLAWGLLSMSLTVGTSTAVADDTEIFFTDASKVIKPNILFILDKSGSMSNSGGNGDTRLEVVQDVMSDLLDDMKDVNVGAMYFGGNEGGYFLSAIKPIDDVRATLKAEINKLSPGGNTPLSETTFEAMRYFQGGSKFIRSSSVADVMKGNKYNSPIEYQCQPNNIILLTDGQPTSDTNHEDTIEGTVGKCSGNCLDEIADHMYNNDMSTEHDDSQSVRTYTVGFQTDQTLLSNAATKGGGQYLKANDAASLKTAFTAAFNDILATSATYVAPGIAVNTFDRLNHLDALYFALFEPSKGARWPGNLKRYKLAINTDANTGQNTAVIVGEDGKPAVDPVTGFFKDSAQSWWGNVKDGKVVTASGASSQHADPNSSRKVYSNLVSNKGLTNSANAIAVNNSNLTKALFGNASMSNSDFKDLIRWTRGQDLADSDNDGSTSDSRKFIADPLHSVPHLIVYGGSKTAPDTVVFFGDNQGFIHGIDGETGKTHFSFMPSDLLKKQAKLKVNSGTSDKVYGMDSPIISWIHDSNNDGNISSGKGDFAYIYAGMRRGGSNYYALDVTDPDQPDFLWTIQGGKANTDFSEMGQTWSTPVKTKVTIGKNLREVLIFGGGYDADQDDVTVRTTDDSGRALYIVDAKTGARLWWAGPAGSGADLELASLKYSIPSSPKVLDLTGDGMVNQIYVGDMGGQIFRFDVTNTNSASDLVTGGVIADLAEDNKTAGNRRFYHAPDLFGMKFGGTQHLGLIIGSGFQAHPLNKDIDDRIYMIRIPEVSAPPVDGKGDVTYTAIAETDLYDATDNLVQQGNVNEQNKAVAAIGTANGWYIRLTNAGEKVLSTSQTINNEVFVTTYEPTPSTNPCIPSAGKSRLYHISVFDGRAVRNYDGIGAADELTRPDREVDLKTIGLPANPQRMRVDDTDVVCVGTECLTIDALKGVVETYWYEE
jgi:type IV pilus assembly protein PilY1